MTAPLLTPFRIAELRELLDDHAFHAEHLSEVIDAYEGLARDFADAQDFRRTYGKGAALDVAKRAVGLCQRQFGKVGLGVLEQHIACDVQALIETLAQDRDSAVWKWNAMAARLIERLRPKPGTDGVYLTETDAATLLAALESTVRP
jgi:hypothetical protein